MSVYVTLESSLASRERGINRPWIGDGRIREIPRSLTPRIGAMISFDRLRRETDEISTKYNRGQKPVEKRGRPTRWEPPRPECRTSLSRLREDT